jgi:excisionase family DNA binding protein
MSDRGPTSPACARERVSCAHAPEPPPARVSEGSVTALSPSWGRLLDVDQAAAYLGLSRWSVYDLVKAGVLRVVRIPSVRVDLGPRKTGNANSRRRVLARPDFRQPLRKTLLDREDLDRWVNGLPHELDPAAPKDRITP